jgi:TetR/AcrR family transcriptional repressor of nem operon
MDMRYSVHHKEHSRARILNAAAKQFRAQGGETVRVTDVMKAAGLTHGGFYKHFADKDQLLREAVETALEEIAVHLKEVARGLSRPEALRKVIATYLSEEHMLHPDLGCALAALGTEMARMPPEMKLAVSRALDAYAERLDFLMPGETADQRRAAFLVLFPSMAGCIMAARAHANRERQAQILSAGRAFFDAAFCGAPQPSFLNNTLETMQ